MFFQSRSTLFSALKIRKEVFGEKIPFWKTPSLPQQTIDGNWQTANLFTLTESPGIY
jgi:hypothetical protein